MPIDEARQAKVIALAQILLRDEPDETKRSPSAIGETVRLAALTAKVARDSYDEAEAVASALRAVPVVVPGDDMDRAEAPDEHVARERVRLHRRQLPREGDDLDAVGASREQPFDALVGAREPWHGLAAQHLARVRVVGDDDRLGADHPRLPHRLRDERRVADVDAVEGAVRDDGARRLSHRRRGRRPALLLPPPRPRRRLRAPSA